jgi:hypothetical protein
MFMMITLFPGQRTAAGGPAPKVGQLGAITNSLLGQAARGSGALLGFVDVLIEMRYVGSPARADRRRRVEALSRFDETPRGRVIELSANGTDYACLGDFEEAGFADGWATLRTLLAGAARPLSVREMVAEWPPDGKPPAEPTLWRWLDRALGAGTLRREGAGRRNDPFRYFLPEMPERWERQRREAVGRLAGRSPAG